jgi:hypothetical protein
LFGIGTDQNGDAYGLHPLWNQSFSFWESLRNFLNRVIEAYPFQFETSEDFKFQGFLGNEKNLELA